MKKVLLLGMILVICVLAFPQGVMAALGDSAPAIVTGSFSSIAIIKAQFNPLGVPAGATPWALSRANMNPLTGGINVSVDCNQPWQVNAADTKSSDKGFMTSTANRLINPFNVSVSGDTNWHNLMGGNVLVVTGQSQTYQNYNYNIQQQVTNDDKAGDYAITVTYTLTAN
jgi:hypothetical protein